MPPLTCDLCDWPMTLPDHCREQGTILGLLVCTQCTEDALDARALNEGSHLELVGASR